MLPGEAPRAGRPPRFPPRALTRLATTAAAVLAAVAIAGCDDDEVVDPADAATNLTITLDADGPGGEGAGEALVRCGDSETVPGEAEGITPECGLVEELPANPAAPTPPDSACTEIYGGPDVARIKGTFDGEPLDAELSRENGCEIERFERWTSLLRELFPGYRPGAALAP